MILASAHEVATGLGVIIGSCVGLLVVALIYTGRGRHK